MTWSLTGGVTRTSIGGRGSRDDSATGELLGATGVIEVIGGEVAVVLLTAAGDETSTEAADPTRWWAPEVG